MDDYRTLQQILDLYKAMYHEEAESIKISLEIIGIYLSQEEIPLNDVIELLSRIAETRAMRQDRIKIRGAGRPGAGPPPALRPPRGPGRAAGAGDPARSAAPCACGFSGFARGRAPA